MRSRLSLLEIFSTFLQFEADQVTGWTTDARLRRDMQRCLGHIPESKSSESFWAMYWHKQWRDAAVQSAVGHLSAHLQETCYWAAYKVATRLEGSQARVSDCFQVAIAQVPKILNAFDSDQQPSLKTYANVAFGNAIRDDLRQRREVDRCNDWGLLLKLSRKQLTEALHHSGAPPAELAQFVLVWQCFVESYGLQKTPGLRKLTSPDRQTWEAITRLYNDRRHQLAQPGSDCSSPTLERWLIACAQRSRAYLYPVVRSLNAAKPGQDTGELQDDLPDLSHDSVLTELIAQEDQDLRQGQANQVNHVLNHALASLDAGTQELLQLYYQRLLTQQQIAQQFHLQQYAVSRKLTKARSALLLALTRWSQDTLHISPTSDVVKLISMTLEEWLHAHFDSQNAAESQPSQENR